MTGLAMWVAIVANRAREQRRAVSAIQDMKGQVLYDHDWDMTGASEIPWPRPPGSARPGPEWLRKRLGEEYFFRVAGVFVHGDLGGASLQGRLAPLRSLRGLKAVSLEKSNVTDEELEVLANQTELIYLWLDDTQISDAGLVHLRKLKQLKFLYMRNTNVTERGVDALKHELPDSRICFALPGQPQRIK
jgi:hypothetical protein